MWELLSTHVEVAIVSEVILAAGALWFALGLRLWWHWGAPNQSRPVRPKHRGRLCTIRRKSNIFCTGL
jgi:hypothetical protein